MRRGVHHALGQRDPWGERNFVIATGAGIADQADGEKNCDHDVLLSEPASDGTRGLRALLPKSVAQERCPRTLPKSAAQDYPLSIVWDRPHPIHVALPLT